MEFNVNLAGTVDSAIFHTCDTYALLELKCQSNYLILHNFVLQLLGSMVVNTACNICSHFHTPVCCLQNSMETDCGNAGHHGYFQCNKVLKFC